MKSEDHDIKDVTNSEKRGVSATGQRSALASAISKSTHHMIRKPRPMAEANPDHIGKFAYCEYWGKWDKILACGKRDSGVFWWQVQEVGERLVRCHSTPIPVDCIFDAPRIEGDHHLPPLRDIADSSKGAEVMAPRCSSAPALQPSSPCAGPDQATPWA